MRSSDRSEWDRKGWKLIAPPGPRSRSESRRLKSYRPADPRDDVEKLQFLAEGALSLASSLDYQATVTNVVRFGVPFLADWCFLHLREPDRSVRRISWAEPCDHGPVEEFYGLLTPTTYSASDTWPPQPETVSPISTTLLRLLAPNTAEVDGLYSLNFCAAMRIPLICQGTYLGVLTLLSRKHTYGEDDLRLAVQIADYAAAAIRNASKHAAASSESESQRQANARKDEVLAILNHELRNLLSPVLGWANILRNHVSVRRDAILSEGSASLQRNARHMARLVDDCLDMNRLAQRRTRMDCSIVNVNEVLLSGVEAVQEAAWQKKQSLVVDLAPSPLSVEGDGARLQQVATNLLMNAIKFTDPGGRLSIRSRRRGDEVEIEVADAGRGIEAADLDRIFEPFYQGTALGESGLGMGLGLAISFEIVTRHHGHIWAESAGPGCGSVFHIRLPLAAPGALVKADMPADGARRSKARRIVVVDDVQDVRELMTALLEGMGHIVVAACDSWTAISYVHQHHPDLIISDLRMSGPDGYSLVRILRSDPGTSTIPVLAVTGIGAETEISRARAAGFDAVLCKPVESDELCGWVAQLTAHAP